MRLDIGILSIASLSEGIAAVWVRLWIRPPPPHHPQSEKQKEMSNGLYINSYFGRKRINQDLLARPKNYANLRLGLEHLWNETLSFRKKSSWRKRKRKNLDAEVFENLDMNVFEPSHMNHNKSIWIFIIE
jgi:hypothetical protein